MTRPLLLLLGDSITELGSDPSSDGWIALLLNRFHRQADVAARGLSGYNTEWFTRLVLPKLTVDLETTLRPSLITLWLGANDAALTDGPSKDQSVSLAEYKANLHASVAVFKAKAPQAKILLITPPPVDDDARRIRNGGLLDRSNAAAGEYATACVQVAAEAGVEALNLHAQFNSLPPEQWKSLLSDGLHLSSLGNQYVDALLTGAVAERFPDLQTRLEQDEFPQWYGGATLPPLPSRRLAADLVVPVSAETATTNLRLLASEQTTVTGSFEHAFSLVGVAAVVLTLLAVLRRGSKRQRSNESEGSRLLALS